MSSFASRLSCFLNHLLPLDRKVQRNGGLDLDGLGIEERWLISPGLKRFDDRGLQQRIGAADNFQGFQLPVFFDNSGHNYRTLYPFAASLGRICRTWMKQEVAGLDITADSNRSACGRN